MTSNHTAQLCLCTKLSRLKCIAEKVNLDSSELDDWQQMAEKMRILYNLETDLFEQHDG